MSPGAPVRRGGRAAGRGPAIDLFAGAGGLTVGLRRAGFAVVGAVERDATAAETYRRNHPPVNLWTQDIRRVSARRVGAQLALRPGDLALLAGCPPCQAFSGLRTLNGGRPVRSPAEKDLLFECLRFVRVLRPRAVMIENVPGLARDRRIRLFAGTLRALGYRVTTAVLDAADYGVPQRRRRFFLLAGLGFSVVPPEPTDVIRTVRWAIGGLPPPGRASDPLQRVARRHGSRVADLIRRVPTDGGGRADLGASAQLPCHLRVDGFSDVYGRMRWDAPSPTITAGFINPSKGRFIHPDQDRAVTLREGAVLQSFPRRYWFSRRRGIYDAARQIGNALPPRLTAAVARAIARQLAACGPPGPGVRGRGGPWTT